jgi:hypothetical protein
MIVKTGIYYMDRRMVKHGPMRYSNKVGWDFTDGNHYWMADGRWSKVHQSRLDLIAEWQEPGTTLSGETIDQIAIDSLKFHFDQGFDSDLEKEAFRIVLRSYGVTV